MNKIRSTAQRVYSDIRSNPQKAVKPAIIALMCCMFIAYVCYMCTFTAVTVAYADGVRIGAVNSADVFAPVMQASNDAKAITYPPAKTPDITFEVSLSRGGETLSQKQIYEKVYAVATDGYRAMYGLYVDGKFSAAGESREMLNGIIKTVEDGIKAQGGEDAHITSSLEVKKVYCKGEYAHTSDRILAQLSGGLSYTDFTEGEDIFNIFFEEDADKSFAPDISNSNPSGINTNLDTQIQTKYVTVSEEIPFGTVYEQTEKYFKGTYIKKNDGENGIKTVTYEIRYENGREISRTAVEESVLLLPVDKTVYMGVKEKPKTASTGEFIWPLEKGDYIITSDFGYRHDDEVSGYHDGIDMGADKGTTISAADGGRVIVAETHRSYGIYVIIQHDDGTKTVYAHMSKRTVSVGDRVYQGQKIGEVGSTGYSTGDHLHFEIIKNGNKVDPEKYLPKR